MCIAILKTKKGKITDEALINSFDNNNDGAGIAYTLNGTLIIEKGIFDKNEFIKKVREIEKICDNNMLIHCRIGTSGNRNAYCTHPFIVNDNVCLIHNGILDINVPKNSKENDTQLFIKKYMSDIKQFDLMHNKSIHKILEEMIGKNNKFVLLDNKGYYKIINEKAGHWNKDVWYSNNSYKKELVYDWSYYGNMYSYGLNTYYAQQPEESLKQFSYICEEIDKMTLDDFVKCGYYPVYDFDKECITSDCEYTSDNYSYLEDINTELYYYYLDTMEAIYEYNSENEEKLLL